MNRKRVAVIGGGASGLAAAAVAAENASVTVYEKNERVGKKLLQTGNGRCNIFNTGSDICCYGSEDGELAAKVLSAVSTDEIEDFFKSLGLLLRIEEKGRVYPLCNQASAVLDVLRYAAAEKGASIVCGFNCSRIKHTDSGFEIYSESGEREYADAVILACGGMAAPKTGSDGTGYAIAKALGHSVTRLLPALVPLKLNSPVPRALKGIRAKAGVSLFENGRQIAHESGEIQFTDYGISGIAVMQLSRLVKSSSEYEIEIDFAEGVSVSELACMLETACAKDRELQDIALGIVQKRIAQQLIKRCTDMSLAAPAAEIGGRLCTRIAREIKGMRMPVSGTLSWDNAQVTSGGVPLRELKPESLESKICPGLYMAGEMLDCDGRCGGYNLGWAWRSGIIAGRSAGKG